MKTFKQLIEEINNINLDEKCWPGYKKKGTKILFGKRYPNCVKEEIEICETANAGLAAKAEKSGISIGILRKVYNRGMAAWKTGHRPGTTPQQWAMARVNSYIGKGSGTYHGADKDLREDKDKGITKVAKDSETGLPKKYVDGVSDSTAKARAAHFKKNKEKSDSDPTAYKPAPGDATAKTKPSKHTLKYRAMFGEEGAPTEAQLKGAKNEEYEADDGPLTEDQLNQLKEGEAWTRKEGQSESGGLNRKGIESYRRANPGSKLSMAVTTKPSKLKPGSKAANRRKSFCARMGGMKRRLTSAKTARDPDSRINKALRKWNC